MTPTKKIVCAGLGIMGGIVLFPTVSLIGASVPIYILNKLEDTTIGEKTSQTIFTDRPEYTGWKYDYPKSYACSFFVAGMFSSIASGYFFRGSYLDFKILLSADTCCKTIKAGFFQSALILPALIGSGFSIVMFLQSYSLSKYYNKYKNENIWGYSDSWDVRMQRRTFEREYRESN